MSKKLPVHRPNSRKPYLVILETPLGFTSYRSNERDALEAQILCQLLNVWMTVISYTTSTIKMRNIPTD